MKCRNRYRLQKAEKHLEIAGSLQQRMDALLRQAEALQREAEELQVDVWGHQNRGERLLEDVLLSLGTEYATQEEAWQEGEPGTENLRDSEAVRERIAALEKMSGEDLMAGESPI